jgi:hypothetical protein
MNEGADVRTYVPSSWTYCQRYVALAFQRCRDGIAEELGLGPELADDADLVRG